MFDLQLDNAVGRKAAALLEGRSASDRSRAPDLAGENAAGLAEVGNYMLPREVRLGGAPSGPLLAVDADPSTAGVRIDDLVSRHDAWTQPVRAVEVLGVLVQPGTHLVVA